MFNFWKQFKIACLVSSISLVAATALCEDERYYRQIGKLAFDGGKYQDAIKALNRYLALYGKDYDAWGLVGASYFHTGLPEKALSILKRVAPKSLFKSFNLYYQGLCYQVIGDTQSSKKILSQTVNYHDIYASYAMVELAVMEYEEHNFHYSKYWIEYYLHLYPSGPFAAQMVKMKESIEDGEVMTNLKRTSPDTQRALYKFNKFSLMNYPHFWWLQGGYYYETGSQNTPLDKQGSAILVQEQYYNQFINLAAGFGLGPIKQGGSVTHVGYNYIQHWLTTNERFDEYLANPSDLSYQPFRPDLLERHHQFYVQMQKDLTTTVTLGGVVNYEIVKMATSLIPNVEDYNLRSVVPIAETSTIIPWVRFNYGTNYATTFYLFLRKEIDEEDSSFSNKTYVSPLDNATVMVSAGVTQKVVLPKIRSELTGELFRYQTMYNDFWLDNTRVGGLVSGTFRATESIRASLMGGYYVDSFTMSEVRSDSCSFAAGRRYVDTPDSIKRCTREDTGFFVQVGAQWNISHFHSISGYYRNEQSGNAQFKIQDMSSNKIFFTYTFAFPDLDTVTPFITRIEDEGFNKQVR